MAKDGRAGGFFGKGKRRGYWSYAACGMVSRTNKSSTRLKLGWLMASWEKKVRNYVYIHPSKVSFSKHSYRPRACCLDWRRCSPRIHSKPRWPAVLSPSGPTVGHWVGHWKATSRRLWALCSSGVRHCSGVVQVNSHPHREEGSFM